MEDGAILSKRRCLVAVQPEISEQIAHYLNPAQYLEPENGSSNIAPNTNIEVIANTSNVLQAFAFWAIIAHTVCEYSFAARLARKHDNLPSIVLQFSFSPMKIEYSDRETWYFDFTTIMFNGICNFIPVEYDFIVETEKIEIDADHNIREDTVYTMWAKFFFPGENSGFAYYDILNKEHEKIGVDGVFSFTIQNLFLYVKLVLKKIDPKYLKDDIYFRVPELKLNYDYTNISVQVAHDPKLEKKETDSSMSEPNLDQILTDFFSQQIRDKELFVRRIQQAIVNQIGVEMMKAKSVSQCLCILNQALSRKPANFNGCNEIMSRLAIEVYFLVNDRRSRTFITDFFKNSLPNGKSISNFNRAYYSKEYATIDSIQKYPSALKTKSDLRSFLMDENVSVMKLLDDSTD